jgi:hypothetical protein
MQKADSKNREGEKERLRPSFEGNRGPKGTDGQALNDCLLFVCKNISSDID